MDAEASDAALAMAAASGDERAYAVLVRRHKARLYRLMRLYCGDADEAYEAVQESFIAAWIALRRYDPARPFATWLRTIAINKARDRGRRMIVRRVIFAAKGLEESNATAHPDDAPGAEARLIEAQDAARLARAIARLPTNLKAPLLLTAFEDYSQAEAADILGLSVKSIETRIYRARKRLAEELDDDAGDAPG